MYIRILILLFCINKIFSETSCCKTCQICKVSCIKKKDLDIDYKNINNNTIGIDNNINLDILKTDIEEKIGQKIIVRGSLGRSKSFEKEATIEKAYSNIFVIKYNENNQNVTYSYTDILTRTVDVQVFNGEEYIPLIPPVEQVKKVNNL